MQFWKTSHSIKLLNEVGDAERDGLQATEVISKYTGLHTFVIGSIVQWSLISLFGFTTIGQGQIK